MEYDTIILPSGTELSVEAAQGDLVRAKLALLDEDYDGEASDLDHVRELLDELLKRAR